MIRRMIPVLLAGAVLVAPAVLPDVASASSSGCNIAQYSPDLSYGVCILPGSQVNSELRDVKAEYQGNPEIARLTLYINGKAVVTHTASRPYSYWVVDMGNHYNGDKAKVCTQSLPFAGVVCSPTVTL